MGLLKRLISLDGLTLALSIMTLVIALVATYLMLVWY